MPKELESAGGENDADNQTIQMDELLEAEGESEPEEEVETGVMGEGEPEPAPAPKKAKSYTPEEIEELVKSDKDIDTSRLTPEGTALMKSFQKGYTPKLQKLAEERRQFEEERRKYQEIQSQQGQPRDARQAYFEQYMADPAGITAEINAEIQNLRKGTPYDENWEENQTKVLQLQSLKEDFAFKRQQVVETNSRLQAESNELAQAIHQAIPDFDSRREKLLRHAESLGISEEDALILTNPRYVGKKAALSVVKAIDSLYSATIGVESKRKKPTPLQSGGTRASVESAEEDLEKVPIGTYMARRKQKI